MLEDINLLMTKRHDYMSEVIATSKDCFIQMIKRIYEDSKKINRARRFLLRDFQNQLKQVPSWTNDKVKEELSKFGSKIEHIKKMVYNIYTCNIKIYMHEVQRERVNHVPYEEYDIRPFVTQCILNIAREVWRKPYLLYEDNETLDIIKNNKDLERITIQCIKFTLRNLIPLGTFEEVLENEDSSDESESETDECENAVAAKMENVKVAVEGLDEHDKKEIVEEKINIEDVSQTNNLKDIMSESEDLEKKVSTDSCSSTSVSSESDSESDPESSGDDSSSDSDSDSDSSLSDSDASSETTDVSSVSSKVSSVSSKSSKRLEDSDDDSFEFAPETSKKNGSKKPSKKDLANTYQKYLQLTYAHKLINRKRIKKTKGEAFF